MALNSWSIFVFGFNFLALKGSYDTYYVNGNWKIQLPGQVDVEGTKVIYDRKGTWERLIAKGPTKEPLHVMVRDDNGDRKDHDGACLHEGIIVLVV